MAGPLSNDEIRVKFGADTSELNAGAEKASGIVSDALKALGGSAGIAGAAFGLLAGAGMELAHVLISKVSSSIENATSTFRTFGDQTRRLADGLGISTTAASVLGGALDDIGQSAVGLENLMRALTLRVREQETRLNELGLVTRDQNGNLVDQEKLLMNAVEALKGYKVGTDRQLASTEMFGRSTGDLTKLLDLNEETLKSSRKTLEDFDAVMSRADVATARSFQLTLNDLNTAFQAMWTGLGRMLTPALEDMAKMVRDVLPAAFVALKYSLATILTLLYALRLAVVAFWDVSTSMLYAMTEPWRAFASALMKIFKGDFKGAKEELANIPSNIASAWKSNFTDILDTAKSTYDRVLQLFGSHTGDDAVDSSGKNYKGRDKGKKTADKGKFQEWSQELQLMKDEADKFRGLEIEEELKFWQKKLALTVKGTDDERRVKHAIAVVDKTAAKKELDEALAILDRKKADARKDLAEQLKLQDTKLALIEATLGRESNAYRAAEQARRELAQRYSDERKKIAQEEAERIYSLRKGLADKEAAEVEASASLGLLKEEEKVKKLMVLDQQAFMLKWEHLKQLRDMEEQGSEKWMQKQREMEALQNEQGIRLTQRQTQLAKSLVSTWQTLADAITGGISTAIKGVIQGTTSLGDALRNFLQTIALSLVDLGVKMVRDWIMQALTKKAIEKAAGYSAVATNAAVAASGAFAATAAIPFVGPVLAPAAAAEAYTATMAWAAAIPAAAKGFDIPAGMNPVVQAHQKEMILPADLSEGIRQMVAGGRSQKRGDTFISAMDAKSFERYLQSNSAQLERGLSRVVRRNGRRW